MRKRDSAKFNVYFDTGTDSLLEVAETELRNAHNLIRNAVEDENTMKLEVSMDSELGSSEKLGDLENYLTKFKTVYDTIIKKIVEQVLSVKEQYDTIRMEVASAGEKNVG